MKRLLIKLIAATMMMFGSCFAQEDPFGSTKQQAGGAGPFGGNGSESPGLDPFGPEPNVRSKSPFGPKEINPKWAEPTGFVEDAGMLISWSLKEKVVAVIDTTTSSDWVRTQLSGEKMTMPVISPGMCVFLTEATAYGFSAKAGTWEKQKFESFGEATPVVTLSNQMARITTTNDVLVFTHAGRWFSRNSATVQSQSNGHVGDTDGGYGGGSSRILVASVQNGGFFEASTPASNGSPKSSLGGATFVETARTIAALSTGISLPSLRPRRA